MSTINNDGFPVFDADYFARKNAEAEVNKPRIENSSQGTEKREKVASVKTTKSEETELEEFDFDQEKYEDYNSNFAKVMEFYYRFLNNKEIPDELKKQMIFYGGTLAYAILEKKPNRYEKSRYRGFRNNRYFGDIDIFVQLKALKEVRNTLLSLKDLRVLDDSADLFVANKDNEESKATAEQVYNKIYNKDFGFNINLYGMNVNIHPLFQEGKDINSRGFRKGGKCQLGWNFNEDIEDNLSEDDYDDDFDYYYGEKTKLPKWMIVENDSYISEAKYPDYFLDTGLVKDYSLEDFITQAKILGKDVNIATLEFTIASKLLARENGYTYRLIKDCLDIDFINENANSLGIDNEKLELLKPRVICNILCAYDIRNGQIHEEIGEPEYRKRLYLEYAKRIEPWS